jgi:putative MATE family efflux protein
VPLLRSAIDRDIVRLALPALGALIAEPLFLLTDTALVGHLGADSLAGLGIASIILQTIVGLLIFLAYATTPTVARRLGAGDRPGAIKAGIDGMWLALGLGVIILAAGLPLTQPVVDLFGSPTAAPAVSEAAYTYLAVSLFGIPGMLLVIAATGLLRGLQDTRTPLIVAVAGFAANGGLNALLIYGFGLGIAGSALGTVIAQWGMAAVYIVIAVRAARREHASLRPALDGVSTSAISGGWLLLRTASLRVAMLATVWVGASLGVAELAALQVTLTVFSLVAFVLDAFAIAGQALIGHGLGAADEPRVRAIVRRLMLLSIGFGVAIGALLAAVSPLIAPVFSPDPTVQTLLTPLLIVLAASAPLAGFVFVLDGVLIGAGDARYLAFTGMLNLAVYLPLLWLAAGLSGSATSADDGAGVSGVGGAAIANAADGAIALIAVQAALSFGYLGARALTLGLRVRSDRWMITGATRC